MNNKHKIIVAVTGASGVIYSKVLFDKLLKLNNQIEKIGVIMSDNAKFIWKQELGNTDYKNYPFTFYKKMDFMAPFASGSANYGTMIICPSSMGTMGRIAGGISNDLTTRAADVILKERIKLIIIARETPLSLIHINNMKLITEAGGIICPASPSFYSNPSTFEELAATVTDRALTLAGLQHNSYSWNE
ncbi:MAG: UbiX family flavin prenyltransferase [Bacteroidota bacterium]|nr:UbiX family flavin prenyltransferase [Bacteroidota bacterium]